jgi:hypothetical protein
VYAVDDILVSIRTADEELADELIALLPEAGS